MKSGTPMPSHCIPLGSRTQKLNSDLDDYWSKKPATATEEEAAPAAAEEALPVEEDKVPAE